MNILGKKFFLNIFIASLSFGWSMLCAFQADELHLYKIMKQSPELGLVVSEKMELIIQGINNNLLVDYVELQELFVNICNFFNDKEINAKNVRMFKKEIDTSVVLFRDFYTQHKSNLKPEVRALVKEIYQFNRMLRHDVVNDDQFKIAFSDRFKDTFFNQPLEFAGKNKVLVTGVTLVFGTAIGYLLYTVVKNFNFSPQHPPDYYYRQHPDNNPIVLLNRQVNQNQHQQIINTPRGPENWGDFQQISEPARLFAQGIRDAGADELEGVREFINGVFQNIRERGLQRGIHQIELDQPLHMAHDQINAEPRMLDLDQIQTGDQFIAFVRQH